MVEFVETETQSPIKHIKAVGFRCFLAKKSFPVEKYEDDSGAWQQKVKLPITESNEKRNESKVTSFSEICK